MRSRKTFDDHAASADSRDGRSSQMMERAQLAQTRAATGKVRATVSITTGPSAAAIVGTAWGVASVSLVTVNTLTCVRITFANPMPDTNYGVAAIADVSAGLASSTSRQLVVTQKTTTYCTFGWAATGAEAYTSIDQWAHRFCATFDP